MFHLPTPQEDSLKNIVNGILEANMNAGDHPGLDIELHNGIVQSSVKLMAAVKKVLRPSPMPGRHHYFFTLKDVATCFQVCTVSEAMHLCPSISSTRDNGLAFF